MTCNYMNLVDRDEELVESLSQNEMFMRFLLIVVTHGVTPEDYKSIINCVEKEVDSEDEIV